MKPATPHFRIRVKFIGILILAAVLPVTAALLVFQTLGYRSYREALGQLHQARAEHLAMMLGDLVRQELESLDDWMALSELHAKVGLLDSTTPPEDANVEQKRIEQIEATWPQLTADEPLLHSIFNNEVSTQLHAFRSLHRTFAEIFVTDPRGRLLAATDKTSDYWQADETWWQSGYSLAPRTNYIEGIHYDESAGIYSLDVAVPIRNRQDPNAKPVGVLKGVINVTPLFNLAEPAADGDPALRQVVQEDGRILATLYASRMEPLTESVPPAVIKRVARKQSGWMVAVLTGDSKDFTGYAPLTFSGKSATGLAIKGGTRMFVLVREPAEIVLRPVRDQILLLGLAGAVLLFGFIVAGYFLATRKVIAPIERLREAVHRIAGSVKLDLTVEQSPAAAKALEPLEKIRTRDELEDLARDFAGMAQRVLGYNEQLEREIARKTEEISRDLQLAREFQEALMPHSFPQVPSDASLAPFSLDFRHLYKPALSVGGDFFDVLKLDDQRAGVFIADVMGHGARSALVTAILRTLLQNLAAESKEPARFLTTLNRHFHGIIRNSGEIIFVSAFYLVVDTQEGSVCFASAGHPSPFIAQRKTGIVEPLFATLQGNPALGILPEATYRQWTRTLEGGEVFVLFTDGVHEAYDTEGEEFGLARVSETIRQQLTRTNADIPSVIVAELQQFIAPAAPADDICIVTLEVRAAPAPDANLGDERTEEARIS